MRRQHGFVLALAGAAFIAVLELAATPALADSADDLVLALHYDQYYAGISKLAIAEAEQRLKDKGLAGQKLTTASTKLEQEAAAYQKTFLQQIANSYRTRFSATELDWLVKFSKSPFGEKVGAAQKSIQDDLARATRDAGVFIGVTAAQLAH